MWTDDPARDFEAYDQKQIRRLERLPVCLNCGEPIQDETAYCVCGDWFCVECMEREYKRYVEVGE